VVCGSEELFNKVNIEGSKAIAKAAEKANVRRVIYPSGLGISKYNKEQWATNNYFRSKMKAEEILLESTVPAIIFRPDYILGPGDELIPWIVEDMWNGEVLIAGEGNVPMQPLFVKDVSKIFLAAASGKGKNNSIYPLAGPEKIDMNKLMDLINEVINQQGLNLPKPIIKHITYEDAIEKMDMCKEMIDVMKCDLLPDGKETAGIFDVELTSLKSAVTEAVIPEISIDEEKKDYDAICLLSGGLDSTVSLYWALDQGYDVIILSINYGYRPKKEIEFVKKISKTLNQKLIEIQLDSIKEAVDLRFEGYPIPSAVNAPQGYIPHKNLIFYSLASFFADEYGCRKIVGGQILEDNSSFPDANEKFFNFLEDLLNASRHKNDTHNVKFLFPLFEKTKTEVIKLGKKLNVPFEFTWSCYRSKDEPCGECESCIKRKNAFGEAGLKDSIY
jgi:7-cyano-7-deazaguanine synthase